ncbi:30S ribosomal protein s12-b chloroplastic, partial [Phtheirospermum japonicum]
VNGVPSCILSYSLVLIIHAGKRFYYFFVSVHDLNESRTHPSTCSSMLRTSPKCRGFVKFRIGFLVFLISCLIVGMLNHIPKGLALFF